MDADFWMLKWLSAEVKMRSFSSRTAAGARIRRVLLQPVHGLVAGEQQRLEVGLGAAAGEDAVRGVAEAELRGRPVDEAALDQRAARALVPGVQRGVDGGEDGLAEQRRDDDRAVEVGGVRGVVEVDGVAEVDVLQLVQGGGGVRQRRVQVHGVDPALHLGRADAGERLRGPLEFGGHGVDALQHLRHVRGGIAGVEEVVGGIFHRPGRGTMPGGGAGREGVSSHGDFRRHRGILCLTLDSIE